MSPKRNSGKTLSLATNASNSGVTNKVKKAAPKEE